MVLLAELLTTPYMVQGMRVAVLVLLASSVWNDFGRRDPISPSATTGQEMVGSVQQKAKARFSKAARGLIAEGFAMVRILLDSQRWARDPAFNAHEHK